MSIGSGENPYQAQQIEQADPLRLVELLYEGALRFIGRASESIAANDPEGAHNNILRAYAIVAELQATLDLQQGQAIAASLERCYDFVLQRLKEADISKSAAALRDAERVIAPLLETWREAHGAGSHQRFMPAAPTPELLERSRQPHEETARPRLALDLTG